MTANCLWCVYPRVQGITGRARGFGQRIGREGGGGSSRGPGRSCWRRADLAARRADLLDAASGPSERGATRGEPEVCWRSVLPGARKPNAATAQRVTRCVVAEQMSKHGAFSTPELTKVIGGVHPDRPDIVEGTWVTLRGLKSAPQHNGESAVVFGYDASRGRYKLHTAIPESFGKVPMNVLLYAKPENVELDASRPANPECVVPAARRLSVSEQAQADTLRAQLQANTMPPMPEAQARSQGRQHAPSAIKHLIAGVRRPPVMLHQFCCRRSRNPGHQRHL